MHSILSQRRLRWLGHVHRMDDGRIPKESLYGQLKTGVRKVGRLVLRFKDASKRDLKACKIPGGGALGYFLGGYVPPGTPNWHPVLKKLSAKIDTPF